MPEALDQIAAALNDPASKVVSQAPKPADSIMDKLREEMPDESPKPRPAPAKEEPPPTEKPKAAEKPAPAKPVAAIAEKKGVPAFPKPEAPPVSPDAKPKTPDATDVPAYIKSDQAKNDWMALRTRAHNAESRIEQLTKELDTLKKSAVTADTNGEATKLKTEVEELSKRLAITNIQLHPRFQAAFDQPMSETLNTFKVVVGDEVGQKLANIVQQPRSTYRTQMFEEAISELTPLQQNQAASLILQYDRIQSARDKALQDWKGAAQEFAKEQNGQLQQREAAANAEMEKAWSAVSQEAATEPALVVFHKRDGDEAWNKAVDERLELAKHIFSAEGDPSSLARAAFWAAAGPSYLEMVVQQGKEIETLKAQIQAMEGAQPGSGGGGGVQTIPESRKSIIDKFKEEFKPGG